MTYNVNYWTKKGKKKKFVNGACFSSLRYDEKTYDSILYMCPIDKILSLEDVENYLGFLKEIFPEPFKYYISEKKAKEAQGDYNREGSTRKEVVFFKIKTSHLSSTYVLLLLTAFRYPDEYPDIVVEFAKVKGTLEEKFEKFQALHHDYIIGTLEVKSGRPNNMAGHGLMYDYSWCGKAKVNPIKFGKFQANLKSNQIGNVHSYFKH